MKIEKNKILGGGGVDRTLSTSNNNNNKNTINLGTKTSSATKLLICLNIGFLLICAMFLCMTLSMLSDSKTATGTVTFALTKSPTLSMNLYYEESTEIATYLGMSKEQGALLSGNTDILRMNVNENSTISITVEFKNLSGNNEIQTKNTLSVKIYDETGNQTQTLVQSGESTSTKVIFTTSSVNAGDYVIIDQIITGLYPTNDVDNQDYIITVTSQAGNSIPVPATLSGKYTKSTLKYTVNFYDENNSTLLDSKEVIYGNFVTKPVDPVKDGYNFKGWVTEQGEIFDFDNTRITSNLNLYASYEQFNNYTLTFFNNMGRWEQVDKVVYYINDPLKEVEVTFNKVQDSVYEGQIPGGAYVKFYTQLTDADDYYFLGTGNRIKLESDGTVTFQMPEDNLEWCQIISTRDP